MASTDMGREASMDPAEVWAYGVCMAVQDGYSKYLQDHEYRVHAVGTTYLGRDSGHDGSGVRRGDLGDLEC